MAETRSASKFKNRSFIYRLSCAWKGLQSTFVTEKSFRLQTAAFIAVVITGLILKISPLWFALFVLCSGGVLSLELLNTALEKYLDWQHPDESEVVGKIKDTLAAGVLVFSFAAAVVFVLFLCDRYL